MTNIDGRGYSWRELMVTVLARDLRDDDAGGSGVNSLIPWAAILLARATHAPNLVVCGEPNVNPDPGRIYPSATDSRGHARSEAIESFLDVFGYAHRGLDFWFYSGLQIDAYGNVNLHRLGEASAPDLIGPGVPNVAYSTSSRRFYLYSETHTRRTFVEKVDFISVPGNLSGPASKREIGLETEGPRLCVTPIATFDFHPESLRMRLRSVHEGLDVSDVIGNTGFHLGVPPNVPITEPPSQAELVALREQVDPDGLLRPD